VSEPWWISAIKGFVIINIVLLTFAYTTLLERKALGRMQLRYGPNRAGPYGLLQPIADLIKLVRKESFFPAAAIDAPYILAPVVSAFTALAAFIGPLAGIANFTAGPTAAKSKQTGTIVRPEFEAYVSLAGLIDVAAEIKRLEKQIGEKRKQLDATKAKLANEGFVSRAPAEVVQQQREQIGDAIESLKKAIATGNGTEDMRVHLGARRSRLSVRKRGDKPEQEQGQHRLRGIGYRGQGRPSSQHQNTRSFDSGVPRADPIDRNTGARRGPKRAGPSCAQDDWDR